MGIPNWIWQSLSELSDEELVMKVLSGDHLGGYAAWTLQERQACGRTYRRRKMLARINRYFQGRNRIARSGQLEFRW